jgi:Tfp pilus assembly protein PilF
LAAEIGALLAIQWVNRSRYQEAANLCEKTLGIAPDDYRLLHHLARAEDTLGQVKLALKHYQQSLQNCPAEEEEKNQPFCII